MGKDCPHEAHGQLNFVRDKFVNKDFDVKFGCT